MENSNKINFYDLFEVHKSASPKEILMSYENKITKFYNFQRLNEDQIHEIKLLKTGLHILIHPDLRKKYNKSLFKSEKKENKPLPKKIKNEKTEPVAENEQPDDSLDSLFKLDNEWMKTLESNVEKGSKKNIMEKNYITERVFSLPNLNKKADFPSELEAELRRQKQGREDKSSSKMNE
jgi:DnaJ-class molecular chaperone